ncbi:hypothetical protein ACFW1P_08110 [Paenibacillus sp. NPDC058910]|uniref:hypothetical protein n=1 Tax=unclassified Paenibacillus TaxID=185978 RepID=UPI0036855DBF
MKIGLVLALLMVLPGWFAQRGSEVPETAANRIISLEQMKQALQQRASSFSPWSLPNSLWYLKRSNRTSYW